MSRQISPRRLPHFGKIPFGFYRRRLIQIIDREPCKPAPTGEVPPEATYDSTPAWISAHRIDEPTCPESRRHDEEFQIIKLVKMHRARSVNTERYIRPPYSIYVTLKNGGLPVVPCRKYAYQPVASSELLDIHLNSFTRRLLVGAPFTLLQDRVEFFGIEIQQLKFTACSRKFAEHCCQNRTTQALPGGMCIDQENSHLWPIASSWEGLTARWQAISRHKKDLCGRINRCIFSYKPADIINAHQQAKRNFA